MVQGIVLNDQKSLKAEKISEFEHGKRPDGTDIGYYRSKAYEDFKYRLNPLAQGTIDLMLTGQTVSTLFIKNTRPTAFIFDWNDRHNLLRFGQDILGINQEWWEKRQKEVYRNALVLEIKNKYKIG